MKQITSGLHVQVNKSVITSCVVLEQIQAENVFNMLSYFNKRHFHNRLKRHKSCYFAARLRRYIRQLANIKLT